MTTSTGRSLMWALLESAGLSVLSLGVLLVVARLVGPAELGVAALALGLVQLLTIAVEMLMHDAIVQRPDLDEDHLSTAFWTSTALGLALSVLCALIADPLAALYDTPALAPVLTVAGAGLVFSGAGCIPIAILRRNMNFKPVALRSLNARMAAAIVAIIAAALGAGIWALIAQQLIQTILNAVLALMAARWRPSLRFRFDRLTPLLKFGLFAVGSRLVWLGNVRLFTMMVGYFLGMAAVGHLNIAQRFIDTLYDIVAGAAYNLALPFFSRLQSDRPALARAYYDVTEMAALSMTPVFAGLAVCAGPMIAFFLGAGWEAAAPLVSVLAIGAIFQFVFLFGQVSLTASGKPAMIFLLSIISFAIVITLFFIFRPTSEVAAVSLWVGRVLISGPIQIFLVHRMLGLAIGGWTRRTVVPLAAAALMVVALFSIQEWLLADAAALLALAVMIPLGAAVYSAIVALADPAAARRFVGLVASNLKRAET